MFWGSVSPLIASAIKYLSGVRFKLKSVLRLARADPMKARIIEKKIKLTWSLIPRELML